MPDESYPRSRLRQELARVRDRAGLSQRKLAEAITAGGLDVTYGTIARDEHGPTLPPLPRVRAWLDACDVQGDERDRILDFADRARSETRPWSELLSGPTNPQDDIRAIEQNATLIRGWDYLVFPGILQAPEYAVALMEAGWTTDIEGGLAARLRRQNDLYTTTARHQYVISESAWLARWAPEPVARAQQDRARSLAELDAVSLAVVPETVLLVPAWHNFTLFTDPEGAVAAVREMVEGVSTVTDDASIEHHENVWARLNLAAENVPAGAT